MINYLTTWAATAGKAYDEGNLALWAWSVGAQILPFAGVALVLAGLGFIAFKFWEEYAF